MLALIAPGEHEVLIFLVQLVAILSVARLLGLAMSRIGQPAVVGELMAGILLGPSILGRVSPELFDWIFPNTAEQGAMLYGVAWLGLLLLLAATGLESDLGVLARLGRPAVLVTLGSLLVPLGVGFAVGYVVPEALLG
jgi:Kef-type K+ transport system membrane component KefB